MILINLKNGLLYIQYAKILRPRKRKEKCTKFTSQATII